MHAAENFLVCLPGREFVQCWSDKGRPLSEELFSGAGSRAGERLLAITEIAQQSIGFGCTQQSCAPYISRRAPWRRSLVTTDPATICMSGVMKRRVRGHGFGAFGRFDGIIDGLRSLVDVARGSEDSVCGNVLEEVGERFTHSSVSVDHKRNVLLVHRVQP